MSNFGFNLPELESKTSTVEVRPIWVFPPTAIIPKLGDPWFSILKCNKMRSVLNRFGTIQLKLQKTLIYLSKIEEKIQYST